MENREEVTLGNALPTQVQSGSFFLGVGDWWLPTTMLSLAGYVPRIIPGKRKCWAPNPKPSAF